jgi:ATP-dependent RNA helicase SUPV3L1/SUV3
VVEGHVIGRLDGFVFVPDSSSGGSEAKALQNAAQKALASEIAVRATRLAEAPDDQFVLAADGTLRWTGAAVGKLQSGEDVMRPRVRVVADEHLTGAPRDAVETRLNAFVKSHFDKLLGPLTELSAAEDVTGIARGIAFQLVEALGVLDRQRVAEEVKGLEQPARASLRKYGVRFGAYHIYLPVLLKPTPRALALQLWARRHDTQQGQSFDALTALAGSGRTSIPVDRAIDAALYRTAGYRVCGERAVRVDILERLADLIRPALSWREGSSVAKPPGAFPGGGFTVVNGMTSLTGASGEDFASVLRSLGYRMERRAKPQEAQAAQTPGGLRESQVVPPVAVALTADTPSDSASAPASEAEAIAVENPLLPTPELIATAPEAASVPELPEPPAPAESVPASTEPEMIEVWRPGRPEGRKRPRHRRREAGQHTDQDTRRHARHDARRHPRKDAPAPLPDASGVPPVTGAETAASPPAEPASPEAGAPVRDGGRSRHRRKGEHRHDSPQHDRPQHERHERPHRNRPPVKRFERREKVADPNSPFAKLAALKAQLEADAKERR